MSLICGISSLCYKSVIPLVLYVEYGVSDFLSNIAGQVVEGSNPLSLSVIFTLGHTSTIISCMRHHGSRQCNHRDIIKH